MFDHVGGFGMLVYRCDVCGKMFEGNDEGECCRVMIGNRSIGTGRYGFKKVAISRDICLDCTNKILEIIGDEECKNQ